LLSAMASHSLHKDFTAFAVSFQLSKFNDAISSAFIYDLGCRGERESDERVRDWEQKKLITAVPVNNCNNQTQKNSKLGSYKFTSGP